MTCSGETLQVMTFCFCLISLYAICKRREVHFSSAETSNQCVEMREMQIRRWLRVKHFRESPAVRGVEWKCRSSSTGEEASLRSSRSENKEVSSLSLVLRKKKKTRHVPVIGGMLKWSHFCQIYFSWQTGLHFLAFYRVKPPWNCQSD